MRSKSNAFTIIELLVSTAIIAVLLAILLPALSSVRRSARDQVCRSNLRGIAQTINVYRADHKLRYPTGWVDLDLPHPWPFTCPEDPYRKEPPNYGVNLNSYLWVALPSPAGRPMNASNLVDTLNPQSLRIASDHLYFRHWLRSGERMDPDPNSQQWERTARMKGYLDGHVEAMRGPQSDCLIVVGR